MYTDEEIKAIQQSIYNGSVWRMEGAAGREAMRLLEAGVCELHSQEDADKYGVPLREGSSQKVMKDYWGNVIPCREWLQPGTKGAPLSTRI